MSYKQYIQQRIIVNTMSKIVKHRIEPPPNKGSNIKVSYLQRNHIILFEPGTNFNDFYKLIKAKHQLLEDYRKYYITYNFDGQVYYINNDQDLSSLLTSAFRGKILITNKKVQNYILFKENQKKYIAEQLKNGSKNKEKQAHYDLKNQILILKGENQQQKKQYQQLINGYIMKITNLQKNMNLLDQSLFKKTQIQQKNIKWQNADIKCTNAKCGKITNIFYQCLICKKENHIICSFCEDILSNETKDHVFAKLRNPGQFINEKSIQLKFYSQTKLIDKIAQKIKPINIAAPNILKQTKQSHTKSKIQQSKPKQQNLIKQKTKNKSQKTLTPIPLSEQEKKIKHNGLHKFLKIQDVKKYEQGQYTNMKYCEVLDIIVNKKK